MADVWGLAELEAAIRSFWSLETCDESDAADWSPANPARGQCGVTALTINDLMGGELLVAEVLYEDGSRQGYHCWNRLAAGLEIDLTREQFSATESVQEPWVVDRPSRVPGRGAQQYVYMRTRVNARLGLDPAD